MDILKETTGEDELVGRLAVAFTHLSVAPYTSWNYDGDPAQMAAYVVRTSRQKGTLGMLMRSMGVQPRNTSRN